MFWGTRATNFPIYTTKMEGAGPKILGTGAKFKQVPCQKKLSCKPGFNHFNASYPNYEACVCFLTDACGAS